MKRLLSIQDISCYGKCSQTIVLPVLSAMGVETTILPTALLSTHTLYPDPVRLPLTGQLLPVTEHWKHLGITFDAIYVGYLGSPEEVSLVRQICREFRTPDTLLFVDPVMGDHGKLYAGFDHHYVEALSTLCADADVLVPNMTEACLLTGTPYPSACEPGTDSLQNAAFYEQLLQNLHALCPGICVITGASTEKGLTGFYASASPSGPFFSYQTERIDASYHGSGDLFASVAVGALLRGLAPEAAFRLAADHTRETIRITSALQRDPRRGLAFEQTLPSLMTACSGSADHAFST